jgi:hypothetical protein
MPRYRTGEIEVHGLKELAQALKELGGDLPRELRETNKAVAAKVADSARGRAHALGSTAAHVAPTIKASAGAQSAAASFGGVPEAAGAEFGGRGRPTTQQFLPHRGTEGYFVFPAIRDEAPHIEDEYRESLDKLIRKAGLA